MTANIIIDAEFKKDQSMLLKGHNDPSSEECVADPFGGVASFVLQPT